MKLVAAIVIIIAALSLPEAKSIEQLTIDILAIVISFWIIYYDLMQR